MPNIGTCYIKMDGLWSENTFHNMFVESWDTLMQDFGKNPQGVLAHLSSRKIANLLNEHAPKRAKTVLKPEFLDGQMEDWQITCHLTEQDNAATWNRFSPDRLLPLALAVLFPEKEIKGSWFVDGLNEGGEFTWINMELHSQNYPDPNE